MNRERRRPLIVASHGLAGIAMVGYGLLVEELLVAGFGAVLIAVGVAYLRLDR
ncbi:hypothetical protein [Natronococcus occultus]|uniref:Uncharacterized protein n=1 Tax=Natronococcus occultus SP4 TaxID=694430 RepID=L0K105_9EURY|nr:hypothetical protein [Natronococcus occultus]AGB38235.1 hypothetical protein Natoc_2461 [Natronococcus occultus SP4]